MLETLNSRISVGANLEQVGQLNHDTRELYF